MDHEGFRAMYLGRFQIFHKGHLAVARYIDSQPDISNMVIVIGSAQYDRHNKHPEVPYVVNPFTIDERIDMLSASLDGELTKPYEIIGVKDTHVCDVWYNLIMHYAQPEVLYTNEPKEIKTFESRDFPTRPIPPQPGGYHAQVVREMMAGGDNWEACVPERTERFIKQNRLHSMLREFYSERKEELQIVHELQKKDGITPYTEI